MTNKPPIEGARWAVPDWDPTSQHEEEKRTYLDEAEELRRKISKLEKHIKGEKQRISQHTSELERLLSNNKDTINKQNGEITKIVDGYEKSKAALNQKISELNKFISQNSATISKQNTEIHIYNDTIDHNEKKYKRKNKIWMVCLIFIAVIFITSQGYQIFINWQTSNETQAQKKYADQEIFQLRQQVQVLRNQVSSYGSLPSENSRLKSQLDRTEQDLFAAKSELNRILGVQEQIPSVFKNVSDIVNTSRRLLELDAKLLSLNTKEVACLRRLLVESIEDNSGRIFSKNPDREGFRERVRSSFTSSDQSCFRHGRYDYIDIFTDRIFYAQGNFWDEINKSVP